MDGAIPPQAESVDLAGRPSRVWKTETGWTVRRGPVQIDLTSPQGGPQVIEWFNGAPIGGVFDRGRRALDKPVATREAFLAEAEAIVAALAAKAGQTQPDRS